MKKSFIFLIFLFLLSACNQGPIKPTIIQKTINPTSTPIVNKPTPTAITKPTTILKYEISVDCIKKKVISVDLTYSSSSDLFKYLFAFNMSFSSGAYWKDDFFPSLSKYVKELKATDETGKNLNIEIFAKASDRNNDIYRIENSKASSINIKYQVPVGLRSNDGFIWGGYVGKDYCVIDPAIMFLFPVDINEHKDLYGDVRVSVHFNLPTDWDVVTFWEKDNDGNYIGLPDPLRMTKGPFGFGKFVSKQEIINGRRIISAVPEKVKNSDSIIATSFDIFHFYEDKVYGYYDNYNGSMADGYISIFIPEKTGFQNMYHEEFGQFIAMPDNFWPDYIHCIGHNWTAQIEYRGDLWYVTEGFNQYIQIKMASEMGLIKDSYKNSEMRRFYNNYRQNDGILNLDHSRISYDKGSMFAYMLDEILISKSNKKYSIYDLLKSIYQQAVNQKNVRITSQTIQKITEELIGYDLKPLFNLFVLGKEKYPLFVDSTGALKIQVENLPELLILK